MQGHLTMTVRLDCKLLLRQFEQLQWLLEQIPKRRARRFARKAQRLLLGCHVAQRRDRRNRPTSLTGARAVQIRVAGIDELIAAAMRANKREIAFHGCPFQGHGLCENSHCVATAGTRQLNRSDFERSGT